MLDSELILLFHILKPDLRATINSHEWNKQKELIIFFKTNRIRDNNFNSWVKLLWNNIGHSTGSLDLSKG